VAGRSLLVAAVGVVAGCGTKTVTVTRTVTETHVSTVIEQVAAPRDAIFFPARKGELVYKPSVIDLSATAAISKVHWSSYGKAIARGRGSFPLNVCEPTCALAKPDWNSVNIELSRPRPCRGLRAYTRIRLDGAGIKYDAHPYPIGPIINATQSPC
jgi:hypothetical protein